MQLILDTHNSRWQLREAGFTILELMIASTIFTVILVTVAVGVIRFTDTYYKGITSAQVEAANQDIIASVAQAIEFGKTITVFNGSNPQGICVDNTLYAFSLGQEVIDSSPNSSLHQGIHGLLVSANGDCSAAIPTNITNALACTISPCPLPPNTRELLDQHMRVSALDVSVTGNLYTIHSRLIYGEDDLLSPAVVTNPNPAQWSSYRCLGADGEQFCGISDLTTTVQKRLL